LLPMLKLRPVARRRPRDVIPTAYLRQPHIGQAVPRRQGPHRRGPHLVVELLAGELCCPLLLHSWPPARRQALAQARRPKRPASARYSVSAFVIRPTDSARRNFIRAKAARFPRENRARLG